MIRELDLDLNARGALDISVNIPQLIKGEKGDKGDKGDAGTITPEAIEEIASKVDLKDYAKKSDIPDISGKADVNHTHSQYLTQHQSLAGYAKTSDIPAPYNDTEVRGLIAGKADSAHTHSQYLTEHQSLNEYAKTSDIETMIDNKLTPLEALADEILEVM